MRKVIPLLDQRALAPLPPANVLPWAPGPVRDRRGRPLQDLRISLTDRCNFRCTYCMPREKFAANDAFLPRAALLSFEEIVRVAAAFVAQGVRKIRLTGGEPLLRRDVERLVALLSRLRTTDGTPVELSLTTNGSLLARKAQSLKDAGLQRVTVSLDALDDAVFRRMNDVDFPVAQVLHGIDAALKAGLTPLKVNTVVQRGVNDHQVGAIVAHFRGTGVVPRFIEYMDVGGPRWRMDQVVPSQELLQRLQQQFAVRPLAPAHPGETARRWTHADGSGELGFISSVTQAFCGDCSRARLSADGQVYTCLFGRQGHDLRARLRTGLDDDALAAQVRQVWQQRQDRHSELRGQPGTTPASERVAMHYIGG